MEHARVAAAGVTMLAVAVAATGDRRLTAARDAQPPVAFAPVDILASGFRQASAVAVAPDGAVLVADRAAGTVTSIGPAGRGLLLEGLHGPAGIAFDGAGRLLVVEAAARRIVRIGSDGVPVVLAAGLRQPHAIAVGPDGRIWAALREEAGGGSDDLVVRVDESGVLTEVGRGFIEIEALAATEDAVYAAMARLATDRGPARTRVVRIALREDGTADTVDVVPATGFHRVLGLGIDETGDLFVAGIPADSSRGAAGVVVKRHRTGEVTGFAYGLDETALAFAPGGDLMAVEPRHPARVLRFRAPPAPVPAAPAFTNRTPLEIPVRAQPGDRVELSVTPTAAGPPLAALADAHGTVTVAAPLIPNGATELLFRAIGLGGLGLAGPRLTAVVVHDDVLPRVLTLAPASGAHVRGPLVVRARGEDAGSGVANVSFLLDEAAVARVENAAPPAPVTATAVLETAGLSEGPHTLTAAAVDRAGNARAEAQLLVVDRTPPETFIASGPGAQTVERHVQFAVAGSDVWSPALEFSWRLDEGAWSPFGADTVIELTDLVPGPHRFEVKARDLAGNEDATPSAQTFAVMALRLRITAPTPGTAITTNTIWVRGTVDGPEPIRITALLPEEIRGALLFDLLTEPLIAGTFAVEVPVTATTSVLTVTAATAGASVSESVPVTVQPPFAPSGGGLEVSPSAGLAPHAARFSVRGLPAGTYELDIESDGTVDYTGDILDGLQLPYAAPGVHVATVRITTPAGQMVRQAAVHVYERALLEMQLRAAWTGFKDALRAGDVDRAVAFVHSGRRGAWEGYFRQLTPEILADIDNVLTDVVLEHVARGRVECEMLREIDGTLYSFPVSFVIDADGSWRLWQF